MVLLQKMKFSYRIHRRLLVKRIFNCLVSNFHWHLICSMMPKTLEFKDSFPKKQIKILSVPSIIGQYEFLYAWHISQAMLNMLFPSRQTNVSLFHCDEFMLFCNKVQISRTIFFEIHIIFKLAKVMKNAYSMHQKKKKKKKGTT